MLLSSRWHCRSVTCRFSMQNWCPYMSMADRNMDSTWLCRSSYDGRWEAMRTCRARSATLALVVLLSCVSSVSIAMSSSVRVGSRPHSWSYREKLGTNVLMIWLNINLILLSLDCYYIMLSTRNNNNNHISCSLSVFYDCVLTINMVTREFFFVTCAWENM